MWYIDSWAVLDGLAFASIREPDSIEATSTVFLSVPDLEPVPVGRISTALRAQRSCFQEGFRNRAGNEFAFDTLEQIQETVRRAYLGGDIGPAPAPAEPNPARPLLLEREGAPLAGLRKGPSPSGSTHYGERLKSDVRSKQVWRDYSILQYPDKRQDFFCDLYRDKDASEQFYPYLRAFGEGTVLDFVERSIHELHLPEIRERLIWWSRLLLAIGLWDNGNQYSEFLRASPIAEVFEHLRWPWLPWNSSESEPIRMDILFYIPCPLLPGWDPRIRTLSDKLLLALIDRSYFATNKELSEFIPSLFCSLLLSVNPTLSVSGSSLLQKDDRRRLIGRAFHWLTTELPKVYLPNGVEDELRDFAWNRLTLNAPKR